MNSNEYHKTFNRISRQLQKYDIKVYYRSFTTGCYFCKREINSYDSLFGKGFTSYHFEAQDLDELKEIVLFMEIL